MTLSSSKSPRPTAAVKFYRRAMQVLRAADIPFLVAGAYALHVYTGIERDTKDFDIFLRQRDVEAALGILRDAGYTTEMTYPHWLAKAHSGKNFIDLIFSMANGLAPIDDTWLTHATTGEVFGEPVRVLAPEEMVYSKLFTLDRGRFDGADINHLLRGTSESFDWRRLLDRTGPQWRVLLSHLIIFGYVYPHEQGRVPVWVIQELSGRLLQEASAPPTGERVCWGTTLSPTQYLIDVEKWGHHDARLPPWGTMTPEQVRIWTEGVQAGI